MNCPKCDADISESYWPDDPSVGIVGGWSCDACGLGFAEHEYPREPRDGDVPVMTAKEFRGDRPLARPASQISGRPGHDGFAEFCRIARSWGYD
jgi:hypothetical protein